MKSQAVLPWTPSIRRRNGRKSRSALVALMVCVVSLTTGVVACAAQMSAGVAKIDITDRQAVPVNDPLYVKALVLKNEATTAVLITVDAVALGEIGRIKNDFVDAVRAELQKELKIQPAQVLFNASHCHGIVCADVERKAVEAVKEALRNVVPVKIGAGVGHEDRIMENRRLKLKDGREADVRHAYALPWDDEVVEIGPTDPEIGVLRLDRMNGQPLAVLYNFACHPIQGVPSGGNTADITGFASNVIEESLGGGAVALFVQGCAGDINPVMYKDVHNPRDAEPLGNLLGLSTMRAVRKIATKEGGELKIINENLALPRAADMEQRIAAFEAEQVRLLRSLKGTSLSFKTFLPLVVQYKVSGDHPAYYSHRYLHDKAIGRSDMNKLDAHNRANIDRYLENIHVMEQLTRLQANLELLKMHHAQNVAAVAAGKKTLDVEVVGLRVGEFVLVAFPGELSVEIGMNIKNRSPRELTFVAGYSNGYIYYTPTEKQRNNPGYAQEDCDCLVAPQWQRLFEDKVDAILKKL